MKYFLIMMVISQIITFPALYTSQRVSSAMSETESTYAPDNTDKEKEPDRQEAGPAEGEYMETNASLIQETLGVSEYAALGLAQSLAASTDCGQIAEIIDIEKEPYKMTCAIVSADGDIYYVSLDSNGYLGTIRNEEGIYLYAPVD